MSKIKLFFIVGLIIFFIFTLGFGLGYLIAKESNPAPIIIEKNSN